MLLLGCASRDALVRRLSPKNQHGLVPPTCASSSISVWGGGVRLNSGLRLKNLNFGSVTRAPPPRVHSESHARRSRRGGGTRHDPSNT
ncbi:hypothetical protein B296_00028815 [Ensete ventricosum]|uniref:Uncharacterized protein n=1 Tax=Ensete ventricosum TaxID=4639 RepID=A0A426YHL0_ENSVE|nr:hypothetical protein B296_00028815 [Ensete ventricosum]